MINIIIMIIINYHYSLSMLSQKSVLYEEMRNVRDEHEKSKNEISVQKNAARNVRDKIADYQKAIHRLNVAENNYVTVQEENHELR